jgi:hypothetical protein
MDKNWKDYIIEAKRCLATDGYLLISETTKSIDKRLANLKEVITKQGFKIYSEEQNGDY